MKKRCSTLFGLGTNAWFLWIVLAARLSTENGAFLGSLPCNMHLKFAFVDNFALCPFCYATFEITHATSHMLILWPFSQSLWFWINWTKFAFVDNFAIYPFCYATFITTHTTSRMLILCHLSNKLFLFPVLNCNDFSLRNFATLH